MTNTEKNYPKLKACVLGGTGAVGKSLIDYLLTISNKWEEITVISRRSIDRWDSYTKKNSNKKLNFVIKEDLDILKKSKEDLIKEGINLTNYDSIFNCLGYVGEDNEKLKKLDHELVVDLADLCVKFNIKNFSNVSSWYSHPESKNSYFKIKSYAELDLYKYQDKIQFISIYKPGAITNRDNVDSCSYFESVFTKLNMLISFNLFPYCSSNELGYSMGYESENVLLKDFRKKGLKVYNTHDILELSNK